MLKIFFDKYKWIAVAIAFLVYSIGLWHVSSEVQDAGYNRERLHRAEEIIDIKAKNDELLAQVSKGFQESLATIKTEHEQHQKDMNEALKDARYTSCTVSDSVRDLYRKRINKAK